MSNPETGPINSTPEHKRRPTEEERLIELLAPNPEVLEAQLLRLQEITNVALATTIDPHERFAIEAYVDISVCLLTGDHEQLSKWVVVDPDNREGVFLNQAAGIDIDCMYFVDDRFVELGLEGVEEALREDYEKREEPLSDLLGEVIGQSMGLRVMQGFQSAQPNEVPLDEETRSRRLNEIRERLRLSHLLGPEESLMAYPMARLDFKLRLARLDLEVMDSPQRQVNDEEALARARDFIFGMAIKAASKDDLSESEVQIEDFQGKPHLVLQVEGEIVRKPLYDYSYTIAKEIYSQCEDESPLRKVMGIHFLENCIAQMTSRVMQNLQMVIAKARNNTIESFISMSRPLMGLRIEDLTDERLQRVPFGLEGTFKTIGQRAAQRLKNWHNGYHSADVGFSSKATIEHLSNRAVGIVTYNEGANASGRLIQKQAKTDLPQDTEYSLELELTDDAFQDVNPYVPGYVLCFRNDDLFGFKADELGDPYGECQVKMPSKNIEALCEKYKALGLSKLAADLRNKQNCSVNDFCELIRQHSFYYIPGVGRELEINDLEDFADLVEGGKLLTQCDVAAKFLKLSLEEVFGIGCASVTSGNVIKRAVITAFGHTQTVFTYEGRVYILDATAQTEVVRREEPALSKRNSSQPPAVTMWQLKNTAPRHKIVRQGEEPSLTEQVEDRLAVLVKAHDRQDMYEKVMRLVADDPIRKVLDVALQVMQGNAGSEDITRTTEYLSNYLDHKQLLMRGLHLPDYDEPTIDALRYICKRLQAQFSEREG